MSLLNVFYKSSQRLQLILLVTIVGLIITGFAYSIYSLYRSYEKTIVIFSPNPTSNTFIDQTIQAFIKTVRFAQNELQYKVSIVTEYPRDEEMQLPDALISRIKSYHPTVIATFTTPYSQLIRKKIPDIPMVYSLCTDPISAGLVSSIGENHAISRGISDQPKFDLIISLMKELTPDLKSIAIPYSRHASSDLATMKLLQAHTQDNQIKIRPFPIDHLHNSQETLQNLNQWAQSIYLGDSMPIIKHAAELLKIGNDKKLPTFYFNNDQVKKHTVLASYSLDYDKVGIKTAQIVLRLINSSLDTEDPLVFFPDETFFFPSISLVVAEKIGVTIPPHLKSNPHLKLFTDNH